jgi:hypothetical protein
VALALLLRMMSGAGAESADALVAAQRGVEVTFDGDDGGDGDEDHESRLGFRDCDFLLEMPCRVPWRMPVDVTPPTPPTHIFSFPWVLSDIVRHRQTPSVFPGDLEVATPGSCSKCGGRCWVCKSQGWQGLSTCKCGLTCVRCGLTSIADCNTCGLKADCDVMCDCYLTVTSTAATPAD